MNNLISYSLHVTKFYEDHNYYLSGFYFKFFFFFFLIIIFFKGRQNFTPSEILDLELRFCSRRHLIREIVLNFLNLLFDLGPSRFIPLSSSVRRALQDALGAPRVPLASSVSLRDVPFRTHYVLQECHSPHLSPCATCPSGRTTCSKGATRLLTDW
jgi:hypothetical protein